MLVYRYTFLFFFPPLISLSLLLAFFSLSLFPSFSLRFPFPIYILSPTLPVISPFLHFTSPFPFFFSFPSYSTYFSHSLYMFPFLISSSFLLHIFCHSFSLFRFSSLSPFPFLFGPLTFLSSFSFLSFLFACFPRFPHFPFTPLPPSPNLNASPFFSYHFTSHYNSYSLPLCLFAA